MVRESNQLVEEMDSAFEKLSHMKNIVAEDLGRGVLSFSLFSRVLFLLCDLD